MRRLVLASLAVAVLALSAPADSHAAGPVRRVLGRLFNRPVARRGVNVNLAIGGGRGLQFQVQRRPVAAPRRAVRQFGARHGR